MIKNRHILTSFFVFICVNVTWAQSPEGLLVKHFEVMGQPLWDQVSSVTIDGRWVDENYYGHDIKLTFKAPKKIRIQGKFENQTFVEAFNGATGWIVAPWKRKYKPMEMDPQELLIIQNSFHPGSSMKPYEGHLAYTGLVDMEGTVFHTFTIETPQIKKVFYLDQDDYFIYYEQLTDKVADIQIMKVYEDYRSYNGLSVPTSARFEAEGLDKEFVYDELYLGVGARDSIFEMPVEE